MAVEKSDQYSSNSADTAQQARLRAINGSYEATQLYYQQQEEKLKKEMEENNGNKFDPYYAVDQYDNDYNGEEGANGPTTGGGLKYLYPDQNKVHAMQASSLDGIFGIPYQFLDTVDRRVLVKDKESLGRKYIEKIMMHAPLLMITPCRQKFMEGFSKENKETVLTSLINNNFNFLDQIDKFGRYYTTSFAYDEYYRAVRLMCKELAYFLGIDKIKINFGGKYTQIGDIDWYNQKNSAFSKYFAAKNAVVLYADGLVELSDSFNNTTTDSSLAGSLSSVSDQVKEIRFLASSSNVPDILDGVFNNDTISGLVGGVSNALSGFTGGMIGDLISNGSHTLLAGGKLIFPKIWGDSSNSRSYSFNIKLRSPDHDTVSIYFNILVPYIHLLALTLPQSLTTSTAAHSPNAYDTPFLVRAYCKGMFNINMGIITDLSATRGAEAQWNNQGLPTQMDISISIEDLYSNLVMSNPTHEGKGIFQNMWNSHMDIITNTEMIDFLSNLAGLNIAAEARTRKLELLYQMTTARIRWTPSQIFHYFENGLSNLIRIWHDRLN